MTYHPLFKGLFHVPFEYTAYVGTCNSWPEEITYYLPGQVVLN